MPFVQRSFIQPTQRLDDAALEDAPSDKWVGKVAESVNLLNDAVSNQANGSGVGLVAGGQIEVTQFTISVPDPFKEVASTAFLNAWVNFGTDPARYCKHENGVVELQMKIKAGAIGSVAFVLPVQFRPAFNLSYAVDSNGAYGQVTIGANGEVKPTIGNNASVSLDCMFSSKDSSPIVPACWPKQVTTKFASVAGIFVANVEDGTSDGQNKPGSARSVAWQMSKGQAGQSLLINNIMGLPYNRASKITLVVVGG